MTDRAELAKELIAFANKIGNRLGPVTGDVMDDAANKLRQAAAALSAGDNGARKIDVFGQDAECLLDRAQRYMDSFDGKIELHCGPLMLRSCVEDLVEALRLAISLNPQPRKNGEAWILSQPEIDDLRDDAYKTSAEAKRLIAQRMDAPAGATEAQSLGKCFECDGELSVWCSYCNGNATADWLAAIPIVPTDALRKAYQFYLDTQSLRESSADVSAGASEDVMQNDDEDVAYKIGVRDGYESAVQEIDVATGGDGEFRWSGDLSRCIDVPAMKQRILRRLSPSADLPAPNDETLYDEVSEIIAGNVTIEEYFEGDHRKRRITDCGPAAEAVLKHLKSYGLTVARRKQ